MALPSSGAISMSQVNVELTYGSTVQISLNDAAVRTLFQKENGAISMSDGWGKSNGSAVAWVYGQPGGGDEFICEWNNWGILAWVSGTRPIYWELAIFSNGCGNRYVINSGNSGGTGYTSSYYAGGENGYAGNGTYTGGSPYKAAHYELKVWNSVNTIYSGKYHVNYGPCTENCTCPGYCSNNCEENCCCYDCSGDGVTCCDDGTPESSCCRGDCSPGDPGWACGYTCSCSCPEECSTTYDYTNYSPNGTCN